MATKPAPKGHGNKSLEGNLDAEEEEIARQHASPRALVIHEIIREDGEQELSRTAGALILSGLAAGLSMGFSFLVQALLQANLPDAIWRPAVTSLGYSVGFVIVVLGRQQLFTESTLTAVLPLLTKLNLKTLLLTLRLWAIVVTVNLVGTWLFALLLTIKPVFSPEVSVSLQNLARAGLHHPFWIMLLRGVLSGWLIALMVWISSQRPIGPPPHHRDHHLRGGPRATGSHCGRLHGSGLCGPLWLFHASGLFHGVCRTGPDWQHDRRSDSGLATQSWLDRARKFMVIKPIRRNSDRMTTWDPRHGSLRKRGRVWQPLLSSCWWGGGAMAAVPLHRDVLVFVPAYEASQLFDPNLDKARDGDPPCVWGNYNVFLSSKLYFALRMPNPLTTKPLLAVGPVDVYRKFVTTMTTPCDDATGFRPYTLGSDFFIFTYDWRQEIETVSAPLLGQALERYARIHESRTGVPAGQTRFIIVTHSMGGLVARTLLAEKPEVAARVSRLYLVGSANAGSVKAIRTVVVGPDSLQEYAQGFPGMLLGLIPTDVDQNVTKLVGITRPSLYELLPANDPNWTVIGADGGKSPRSRRRHAKGLLLGKLLAQRHARKKICSSKAG